MKRATQRRLIVPVVALLTLALAGFILLRNAFYGGVPGAVGEQPKPSTAREGKVGKVVAYVGATLLDGTRAQPLEGATLLVEGTRIAAVGTNLELPDGAEIVDLSGEWIIPGLIDAHVHFMTSGRLYTRPGFFDLTDKVPYEDEVRWIQDNVSQTLSAFLCSGVTSVLSLGGPSLEYETRELAATMHDAPSVFLGHGVITHAPPVIAEKIIPPWDGELTIRPSMTVEASVAHVREAVARHADLVKTAVDDRGSFALSSILRLADWRKLQGAIVDEAAKHGLRVTTHAHALEYARGMMELGAASLQHIPTDEPIDDEFIALAKEKDVIVVPTLALGRRTFVELITKDIDLLPIEKTCAVPGVVESWYDGIPDAARQAAAAYARRWETARANAKALFDGGVTLAVGTDVGMIGLAPGPSIHLELKALSEVGIPNDYLIRAATLYAARVAGKEEDYGTLEPGKFADFLVLDADPLQDIGNLQKIQQVVKFGRVFAQEELLPES